ncbi:MAG: K(+)-transporting ATPase subunit F [Magnetococcus sp. WYHC-3]
MNVLYAICLVLVVGVFVYLIMALLHPERFS